MKKTLLLLIAIIISFSSYSQKKKLGFWENLFTKKSTKLEFKQINHNVVVPVRVNDSDTLWFILDTGLGTSLISELSPQDSLTINYAKKIKLHGLGPGESLEAYSSHKNDIHLEDIHFKNQDINVLLQDIFYLSLKAGSKINGIIGSTVFEKYIVEIDYDHNKLEFHKPEYYKHKKRKNTICLPLEFNNNKPYIRTWITDTEGHRTSVKLLIDTGASLALWLQESENISIPKKNIYNIIGQGLNGDIHGNIGRIKNIEIGKYILNEPIASFPDTNAIRTSIMNDHRNGSIGGDILRRFTITIDYPNKKICFKPNKSFKKAFLYNNSGIALETPYPGLKVFIISDLMDDSPAKISGIEVGDQILSLNNKMVQYLNLRMIYKTLSSIDKKEIKITVLRKGKKRKFIILTRKMI